MTTDQIDKMIEQWADDHNLVLSPDDLTRCTQNELAALVRMAVEEQAEKLHAIKTWCDAYPIEVFPEPDLKAARTALEAAGISLDSVTAYAMRHVVNGVAKIAQHESKEVK